MNRWLLSIGLAMFSHTAIAMDLEERVREQNKTIPATCFNPSPPKSYKLSFGSEQSEEQDDKRYQGALVCASSARDLIGVALQIDLIDNKKQIVKIHDEPSSVHADIHRFVNLYKKYCKQNPEVKEKDTIEVTLQCTHADREKKVIELKKIDFTPFLEWSSANPVIRAPIPFYQKSIFRTVMRRTIRRTICIALALGTGYFLLQKYFWQ